MSTPRRNRMTTAVRSADVPCGLAGAQKPAPKPHTLSSPSPAPDKTSNAVTAQRWSCSDRAKLERRHAARRRNPEDATSRQSSSQFNSSGNFGIRGWRRAAAPFGAGRSAQPRSAARAGDSRHPWVHESSNPASAQCRPKTIRWRSRRIECRRRRSAIYGSDAIAACNSSPQRRRIALHPLGRTAVAANHRWAVTWGTGAKDVGDLRRSTSTRPESTLGMGAVCCQVGAGPDACSSESTGPLCSSSDLLTLPYRLERRHPVPVSIRPIPMAAPTPFPAATASTTRRKPMLTPQTRKSCRQSQMTCRQRALHLKACSTSESPTGAPERSSSAWCRHRGIAARQISALIPTTRRLRTMLPNLVFRPSSVEVGPYLQAELR